MWLHLLSDSFINMPNSSLTKILFNFRGGNQVQEVQEKSASKCCLPPSLIEMSQEGRRFGSICTKYLFQDISR